MSDPLLNVMKIMLLAGLYLFFIRVLWSVYNELRDPRTAVTRGRQTQVAEAGQRSNDRRGVARRAPAMAGAPAPVGSLSTMVIGQIVVIEPVEHAGMTWPVDRELTLGRAVDNSIQLNDTFVSGHHARLFSHQGDFFIEDMGSRNGTLLNDQPLAAAHRLVVGDRIAVGVTVVEFS